MMNATTNITQPQLAQKANEVVNQLFWGTMLREFRNASSGTILDSGPGSDTFARQLDQELIKRISSTIVTPWAEPLVKQLSGATPSQQLSLSGAQSSLSAERMSLFGKQMSSSYARTKTPTPASQSSI